MVLTFTAYCGCIACDVWRVMVVPLMLAASVAGVFHSLRRFIRWVSQYFPRLIGNGALASVFEI